MNKLDQNILELLKSPKRNEILGFLVGQEYKDDFNKLSPFFKTSGTLYNIPILFINTPGIKLIYGKVALF